VATASAAKMPAEAHMTVTVRWEAITPMDFLAYARMRFRPPLQGRAGTAEDSTANPVSPAESTDRRRQLARRAGCRRAIAGPGKALYILASGVVRPAVAATASVASER